MDDGFFESKWLFQPQNRLGLNRDSSWWQFLNFLLQNGELLEKFRSIYCWSLPHLGRGKFADTSERSNNNFHNSFSESSSNSLPIEYINILLQKSIIAVNFFLSVYFIATNVLFMQPTWQKVTFLSTLAIYLFSSPSLEVEQGQWRIYCNVFKCAVKGKYFHGPNIKIFNSYSGAPVEDWSLKPDLSRSLMDPVRPFEVHIKDQFARNYPPPRLYQRLEQPSFPLCTVVTPVKSNRKVKSFQSMMVLLCTLVWKD